MAKSKQWVGITRRGNKWRVNVRVAPGPKGMRTKTFELDTSIEKMQAWRTEQKGKHGEVAPDAGTFAADIADYLGTREGWPSFRNLRQDLLAWLKALGGARSRHTITAAELVCTLDLWKTAGVGVPTIRARVASLRAFFNRVDAGLDYKNPASRLPNVPPEPKPEARGLDYDTLETLLASMPEYRTDGKRNLSKRRAYVIGYTGIPPGMLIDVKRTDLDFRKGTVRVLRRKKGGGVEPRTLKLSTQGLALYRAFDDANAYGYFNVCGLNACVKRAAVRTGLPWEAVHTYDARHSFLSQLYRVSGDQATVARFGGHVPGSKATARYTKAAHEDVDQNAIAAFSQSVPAGGSVMATVKKATNQNRQKLPRKATRLRKVQRIQPLANAS